VDLGAQAVLALADEPRDVRGQRLGLEGLVEHHVLDRLVDRFLEARHVRALLARVQVDEAFDLRVEELRLLSVGPNPDHLLDAGHAHPGQADVR